MVLKTLAKVSRTDLVISARFTNAKFAACKKVGLRLPKKRNSNSNGARPIHLITSTMKWIRTSRLSIKNSLVISARFTNAKFAACIRCRV